MSGSVCLFVYMYTPIGVKVAIMGWHARPYFLLKYKTTTNELKIYFYLLNHTLLPEVT